MEEDKPIVTSVKCKASINDDWNGNDVLNSVFSSSRTLFAIARKRKSIAGFLCVSREC